jgi:hypothetical protein
VEGVKIELRVLAVLLVGHMLLGQDHKPWTVDRLCGILEHSDKIPDRKHPDTFSERRKPLRDIPVSLYDRSENHECCRGGPVATVHTMRGGRFDFKNIKPGSYWLVASWNGRDQGVDVVYEPGKETTTVCSEQGIRVYDAGSADWWITVTVD